MKVENKNTDSDYHMACMVCGSKSELHAKAHRNKDNAITGFIYSCEKCDLQDVQFGLWDEKTGRAII